MAKWAFIALGCLSAGVVLIVFLVSALWPTPTRETKKDQYMFESTVRVTKALSEIAELQIPGELKRQTAEEALLDPSQDGWDSEVFAERTQSQLSRLFDVLITLHQNSNDEELARLLSHDVHSSAIRPKSLMTAFQDPTIRVLRLDSSGIRTNRLEVDRGVEDVIAGLRLMMQPLHDVGNVQVHIKVVRVDLQLPTPTTVCNYEGSAHNGVESVQQTATWLCHWDGREALHPQLRSLIAEEFEQVHASGATGKWFADCTEAVLGHDRAYTEHLAYGLNHWMQRIERAHEMDDSVRTGLAVGDANGDGLDDVYRCQGPGLPNRLLVQNADGTVTDRSADAGVDWLDHTSSALFLDLDNDGDQDLAIATIAGLLLMENDSSGRFRLKAKLAPDGTDVQSLTAADYDGDGDLDLFLCAYRPVLGRRTGDFVFHDATTGGPNYLFRNDFALSGTAEWKMTDVTHECGLHVGSTRYSLAAAWEDYDNDGDLDLYVANDYGRNYLYRNDEGHFSDVTRQTGLRDTGFGMSVSWGDYNRDGRMDLYIGNMFSSAGSRITRQPRFQVGTSQTQRALFQRMAKGNSLFVNTPEGSFRDVSAEANVEMGRWAWSSVFVDLNNDGWEDLLVANGYITTEDTGDL